MPDIRFGPGGNPENFYGQGYKRTAQMPEWLAAQGLNAYEYQCGRGVMITAPTATLIGEEAKRFDIKLSVHAPYYINLSSDGERRATSLEHIMKTLRAARWMGATRIVVHSGSAAKLERGQAMELAQVSLRQAIAEADGEGLGDILICPETMGKVNQLGDLDEVMELCRVDDRLLPTIDFGHLHARGFGALNTREDFAHIFDTMESALGIERARQFHSHFSRIEFTPKGGEKKHWRFSDTQYGPQFAPIAELVCERGYSPTFICESMGTMAEDALTMKALYEKAGGGA